MAVLISKASGNLTGASTFYRVDTGALSSALVRFNAAGFLISAAGTQASVTFTVSNTSVIDGVLLFLKQGVAGCTGTVKVALLKSGVEQASVTVNKTDLADYTTVNWGPMLFKFTSTTVGDGAATWSLLLTTTGAGTLLLTTATNSATNFTRALRTPVAATAGAGDNLYIVGEMTGAGTHNSFTVTMDSVTPTAYGNNVVNSTTVEGGLIAVSGYGSLIYGNAAATNYTLRIAGDLRVYQHGTFTIGALGAEIPRNSTAVLEFQPLAADGDFGLICYDNCNVNLYGLSRTAGKEIDRCFLTADVTSDSVITGQASTAMTLGYAGVEATGNSVLAGTAVETAATSTHSAYFVGASITNTVQTATVWLARGAGPANNRYVRITLGNNALFTSVTQGFWSDLDLQAGTASAITNIGTGAGTSVSITAFGAGWIIKLTGKVSTGAATPNIIINACSAVGTLSYLGVITNQVFLFEHVALITAASIPDTTFTVDTDTGWLSGDVFCVSATSKTPGEAWIYQLNANAGASSLVTPLYPCSLNAVQTFRYSGTAPTQAEIILLTRNVKVRSTSQTFSSFVYCTALANVTASWVEFSRLGVTSGTNKRGIEIDGGATTNLRTFNRCSLHDFDANGIYCATVTVNSCRVLVSNCVMWMTGTTVTLSGTVVNGDWTFDNNIIMRPVTLGYTFADIGGTFTNNTVCSQMGASTTITLSESAATIGNFSNITVHSGGSPALSMAGTGMSGTINGLTLWRIPSTGMSIDQQQEKIIINDLVLFGSTTYNMTFGYYTGTFIINGGRICSDTTFTTERGVQFSTSSNLSVTLNNIDFAGGTSIYTPNTSSDFHFTTRPIHTKLVANNCKFGAPLLFTTNAKSLYWSASAYFSFMNYNQVAGDHRTDMAAGQIRTDSVIYNTAAPSLRMAPTDLDSKLESAPLGKGVMVPVANGSSIDVSTRVRLSIASDGTVYNGNFPRLVQRANMALGQDDDLVLATFSGPTVDTGSVWDTTTAATLSGGNLVATNTGTTSYDQGARITNAIKSAGKHYFEITLTNIVGSGGFRPSGMCFGVCAPGQTYSNMGGNIGLGGGALVHLGTAASIYSAGTFIANIPGGGVNGDVFGVAVDLDNDKVWFRLWAGDWNGSVGANPATNTGGVAIPVGSIIPIVTFGGNNGVAGSVFTANFGASAFSGTVPSGFAAGWLVSSGTGVWSELSGSSSMATADGVWEFVIDCDGTAGWVNVDDWEFTGAAVTANGVSNWYNGVPFVGGGGGGGGTGSREYFSVSLS